MSAHPVKLIAPEEDSHLADLDPERGIERNFRYALYAIAVFLIGFVGIGALVGTHGAVIAGGEVSVKSRVRTVAHPQGGVVSEILVKEGSQVSKNQVLMRLDDSVSGVNASASGDSVEELMASAAMLAAERDGSAFLTFPPELTQNPTPEKISAMNEARRLFALRNQSRSDQISQIGERIRQTQNQIDALKSQSAAIDKQLELVEPELQSLRTLRRDNLVTVNRLNQLERTAVDLEGQRASFAAQVAQGRARIAELRQSASQLVQDGRSKAGTDLTQIVTQLNDQRVRSASATDTYNRSLVRAPYGGVVEKLNYGSVGAVIPPMQPIMEIVPTDDELEITAKISPYDIDQVSAGQDAMLRFTAFSATVAPELSGKVNYVSADRIVDDKTGATYYKVTITLESGEVRRLRGLKLMPGMPVEVFVQTAKRSLLSYITKPLRDQFHRAFREN